MQIPDSILGSIALEHRDQALSILEKQLAPCFSGTTEAGSTENSLGSRAGGRVMIPAETAHPCDKSGKPMEFLLQINFAELPSGEIDCATEGLFLLFLNAAREFSNPKDRNSFRCIWISSISECSMVNSAFPDATLSPEMALKFAPSSSLPEDYDAGDEKQLHCQIAELLQKERQIQLFGKGGKQFEVLQEIAAFAGNGVSWSEARRTDSCFSHLVEAAADWRLMLKINSLPGLDLGGKSLHLLLRDQDFKARNYGKCWMIVR